MSTFEELIGSEEGSYTRLLSEQLDTEDVRVFNGTPLPALYAANQFENGDDVQIYGKENLPHITFSIDITKSTERIRRHGPGSIVYHLQESMLLANFITRATKGRVFANVDELYGDGCKISFWGDHDLCQGAAFALGRVVMDDGNLRAVGSFAEGNDWSYGITKIGHVGFTEFVTPNIDEVMQKKPPNVMFIGKSLKRRAQSIGEGFLGNFNLAMEKYWVMSNPPTPTTNEKLHPFLRRPLVESDADATPIPDTAMVFVHGVDENTNQRNKLLLQRLTQMSSFGHIKAIFDREKGLFFVLLTPKDGASMRINLWEEVVTNVSDFFGYRGEDYQFPYNAQVGVDLDIGTAHQIRFPIGTTDIISRTLNEAAKTGKTSELPAIGANGKPKTPISMRIHPSVVPPAGYDVRRVATEGGVNAEKFMITEVEQNPQHMSLADFYAKNIDMLLSGGSLNALKVFGSDIFYSGHSVWSMPRINLMRELQGERLDHILRSAAHVKHFTDSLGERVMDPGLRQEIQLSYQRIRNDPKLHTVFNVLTKMRSGAFIQDIGYAFRQLGLSDSEITQGAEILRDNSLVAYSGESGFIHVPEFVRSMFQDEDDEIMVLERIDDSVWEGIINDSQIDFDQSDEDIVEQATKLPHLPLVVAAAEQMFNSKLHLLVLASLRQSYRNGTAYSYSPEDIDNVTGGVKRLSPEVMFNLDLHKLNMQKDKFKLEQLTEQFDSLINAYKSGFVQLKGFAAEIIFRIIERIESMTPANEKDIYELEFPGLMSNGNANVNLRHSDIGWEMFDLIANNGDDKALRTLVAMDEPLSHYSDDDISKWIDKLMETDTSDDRALRIYLMRLINELSIREFRAIASGKKLDGSKALTSISALTTKAIHAQDHYLLGRYLGNTIPLAYFLNQEPEEHAALALTYAIKSTDTRILANNINNYLALQMELPHPNRNGSNEVRRSIKDVTVVNAARKFVSDDNLFLTEVPDVSFVTAWNLIVLLEQIDPNIEQLHELEVKMHQLRFTANEVDVKTIIGEATTFFSQIQGDDTTDTIRKQRFARIINLLES